MCECVSPIFHLPEPIGAKYYGKHTRTRTHAPILEIHEITIPKFIYNITTHK